MASTSSYFDQTSTFVEVVSDAFYIVFNAMLRRLTEGYHASLSDVIRVGFSDKLSTTITLDFKRYLVSFFRHCCNEYLTVHQQILDKKLEKSDLNENNDHHRYYLIIEKLMSQNDGYKHLNCVYSLSS
jgi:hypothetical protein